MLSSVILRRVTLERTDVPSKRRFLQEPQGDGILHSRSRENHKTYIALRGWSL
jgi:hypothetical protein